MKNKFLIQNYPARDFNSNINILKESTSNFFSKILIQFKNNKFFILFKVRYKDGSVLTYHKGVIINKNSGFAEMII
jgi:hypothetical protein